MARDENNFRCPESGDEFYFPTHRTSFGSSGAIYKDKYGKQLVHPETGVILEPIPKKVDWSDGVAPAVVAGDGKTGKAKRVEQLKQRSKDHFKKEISEQKYQKNKDLIKKYEGK